MFRRPWVAVCLLVGLGVLLVPQQASAQCNAAWAPNVFYGVGAKVSYSSRNYTCQQAHTSQVGWEPPNVPALWTDNGACSGGATPTATARPTATPTGATATPTTRPSTTPTLPPPPTPTSPSSGFPAKVVAPYIETWANINPVNVANATGNKYYTLAFIISRACAPYWNGDTPMGGNSYGSYISQLRGMGGDVAISFGGAAGIELGQACTTVSSLQGAYQQAVSAYNLKWMDLDIEGGALGDTAANDRRNKALAAIQASTGMRISYTLPVMPEGLTGSGISLLQNAKANGLRVDVVNVMTMDYGPAYCGDMGQYAIQAVNNTHNQVVSIGLNSKIGSTPMINTNDVGCEVFNTGDAQEVTNHANANAWMGEIAYWAVGRDGGYTFLNIFKNFR